MIRRSLAVLAAVFGAGVVMTLGGFFLFGDHATAAGPGTGYGMMGSYGWSGMMRGTGPGMMGGAYGGTVQTTVTAAELRTVRDRVTKQLVTSGYKGFTVAEVMAFTGNDYVLVQDAAGKPAFELLADPNGRWLMPEPQSMMWNTSYGMLHFVGGSANGWPGLGGYGTGSGSRVSTAAEAKTRADAWLTRHRPGEATADATALPGYYTIDVTKNGKKVGMLSVNARTGTVWFHTWHGGFLADQDF